MINQIRYGYTITIMVGIAGVPVTASGVCMNETILTLAH